MAWTYSNWITLTGSDRLTQIRLHIQEVSDAIDAGFSADGTVYNPATLGDTLDRLLRHERDISNSVNGGVFAVPTRRRY